MKIRNKLFATHVAMAVIPLLALGTSTYLISRQALIGSTLGSLDSVASRLTTDFEYLSERDRSIVASLSEDEAVVGFFRRGIGDAEAPPTPSGLAGTLQDLRRIDARASGLFLMGLDGQVIASTDPQKVGDVHAGEPFFEQGRAAPSGEFSFLDEGGALKFRFSAPVRVGQEVVGVLVEELSPAQRLDMVGDFTGLGKTGEIVMVRKDAGGGAIFVMPTRFDADAALIRKVPSSDTDSAITQAFNGASGTFQDIVDYRGERVLASSRYAEGLKLVIEVKIDRAEAMAPLRRILISTLLIILLSAMAVSAIAAWLAKSIASPINALTNAVKDISMGKLGTDLETNASDDEIGNLSRSFERILVTLKLAMRETGKQERPPKGKA